MFIEVVIEDSIIDRYKVDDAILKNVPGNSWEQNVAAREHIIHFYLEQIKKQNHQFAKVFSEVSYQLAFTSKMNGHTFVEEKMEI
jgi:hypothetical protein